jgi:hypothetical protein
MKISIGLTSVGAASSRTLLIAFRNIERRFNADYPDESSVATTYARLPVKTPIHIISDTPEGATRRDGNGKRREWQKLFGQIDKYGYGSNPPRL